MNDANRIYIRDIFQIPNLMSLFRIILTPFIGYFLWLGSNRATLVALILLIVAGISDYLDGLLARKLGKITALGKILDPMADKIFANIMIIELIFLRGFPVWLAVLIIVRDIMILTGALKMMKQKSLIPISIVSGKYYFASLAILIISYVIRFSFGQMLFLYIVLALFLVSSYEYARIFMRIRQGKEIEKKPAGQVGEYVRTALAIIIALIYLYKLYEQFLGS